MWTIVWAIDAFDETSPLGELASAWLKALAQERPIRVFPIYVLTPRQIDITPAFAGPWIERYRPVAESALRDRVRELGEPWLERPEVLARNLSTTSQAVRALAARAEELGADLILAASHGRKGLSRLMLGSFAENLLHHSRIPVLLLRPQQRVSAEIRTILLPTELTPRAKPVFRRVVALASDLHARLLLFHAIPHPIEPILQSGAYLAGGSWIPIETYFSSEADRHVRRAKAWARWGRRQGVDVEPILDSLGNPIADSIVYLARSRKVDLVAMETRTGALLSTILGSVTRSVIHHADCPLWLVQGGLGAEAQKPQAGRAA